MSHTGHQRIECSCGAVIAQCRCMGPKDVKVIQRGCPECAKLVMHAVSAQIRRGDA